MTEVKITDMSGQPRSNQELEEALRQVESSMIKDMIKIPPALAVYLGVIRGALIELISLRKMLQEVKKEHEKVRSSSNPTQYR